MNDELNINLYRCLQIQSVLAGEARSGQRLKHTEYFLCGAFTGFVASFAEGPIDLVTFFI